MLRLFFTLIFCLFVSAVAFGGDLYKVSITSHNDAERLKITGAEALIRIAGGYIVLTDNVSAASLTTSGLNIELLSRNIEKENLALDNCPDTRNADKYKTVYKAGELRLFNLDYQKSLRLEDGSSLIPIRNERLKIAYYPPKILNPSFSLESFYGIDLNVLIGLIVEDSCHSYVQQLQDFGGRVAGTSSNRTARDWIRDKYLGYGYTDVTLDSFQEYIGGSWTTCYNVIAVKPGTVYPDRQVVIGAHFDAAVGSPGSDDNGSGTSGVLEIARVLADIETEMTIVFVNFDAEENGLFGAYDYSSKAEANGDNIICMLNMDMIGANGNYTNASLKHGPEDAYAKLWLELGPLAGINGTLDGPSSRSDHYAFSQAGYDVLYASEYVFSTVYHTSNDNLNYMDIAYMTRLVKTTLATAYVINETPFPVKIISVLDVGDGESIQVNWETASPVEIANYVIYYDTSPTPTSLDSVVVTGDYSTVIIDGLIEGQEYSFSVFSINMAGNYSVAGSVEKGTPYFLPRSPFLLHASPSYRSIQLSWINQNTELDFSHYAIIRDGLMLPVEVTGNSYLDDDFVLGNSLHSYFVVAVDTYGNLSDTTGVIPVESRAAILEPGKMLVVNRSCMQSSAIVDEAATGQFMRDALAGYTFDYLSDSAYCTLGESFDIYQLLDYEVVVLGAESGRTDNFGTDTIFGGVLTVLDKYMSFGGKVIMFGRYGDITSGSNDYKDITFNPGTSDYAYYSRFHINLRRQYLTTYVGLTFHSDLIGAHSAVTGYPDLVWDSLATVAHSIPWNTCTGIPCPTYVNLHGSGWEILYTYDSRTDQVPNEGKPVAWRYTGGAYEYILFELPLSFMEPASASLALQTAVSELLSSGWAGVTAIEPDTVDADNLPLTVSILLGDLWESKTAGDVDVSEILINGTVSPASTTVLASHPDFSGEVLQIDISPTDFIGSYSMLIDTNTYGYKVNWEFIGEDDVQSIYGGVTLLGTRLLDGDANGDGVINLGDAIFLINYIFKGGPAPDPLDLCDGNCDGHCNLGDAIFLINYIFKGGTAPGCG